MSDFTKPQNITGWQTYANITLMCRESQTQSKRRSKRKDITTPGSSGGFCWWSGSSSAGHASCGQGFMDVGMHTQRLAPSPFILFRCPSHSFPKVLENGSVGMEGAGREEESSWSHIAPPKASAQIPCLHDIGRFCKLTPYWKWRVSLGLPLSLMRMRKFPKHDAQFRSLINSSIFVSFSQGGCLRQLSTPVWVCTSSERRKSYRMRLIIRSSETQYWNIPKYKL